MTTRCARCWARPRRRTTWRSWATSSRRDEFDAAVAELRARDPRRDQGHDDLRLRPALPALNRPVPQGRPADGPFLQLVHDGEEDVPRYRARTTRSGR